MILEPFSLGSTLEIAHGRVYVTVVAGDEQLRVFYLPSQGGQDFVFSQPGQPFRLDVEVKEAEVELLVFDGTMSYASVNQLVANGNSGSIYPNRGTFPVEQMFRAGDVVPLVFGQGSGIVGIKLFSRRYDLDHPHPLSAPYERGYEIGEAVIRYGTEYPIMSGAAQRQPANLGALEYVYLGTSARMPYGHALISVLVDGIEQDIYGTLDGSRYFVVARPGPYQLKVVTPKYGMVELLTFDGGMQYADALTLLKHGDPGEVLSGTGTFTIDQMVGLGKRSPLMFRPGFGDICLQLFNRQQWGYSGDTLSMVAYALTHDGEYERGPDIGQVTISYGPELPT